MSDLERQIERGGLFTHSALSDLAQRTYETESLVLGLVDVLLAQELVNEDAVAAAAEAAREALDQRGETVAPGIALRVDGAEPESTRTVDCAARMHVCHAVCCKLRFALSDAEVEGGRVKWDLGRPYLIRHEPDGYCTHCDRSSGACGIYAERPSVCRGYTCAEDERIWLDFDNMVLNQEWIDANLGDDNPILAAIAMVPPRAPDAEGDRTARE